MKKFLLPALLMSLVFGCNQCSSAPDEPAVAVDLSGGGNASEPGSISGTISVDKPPRSLIYVVLAKSYDHIVLGRVLRGTAMKESGSFRFDQVKPGTYRLAAFVDINGDGVPALTLEPYTVHFTDVSVAPGEHVEDIRMDGFFNVRNASFRTPERIRQGEKMLEEAGTAVERAYEKLKGEESDLLYEVIPTLRAAIYEAKAVWRVAGNDADWEHFAGLLDPLPMLAEGAMRGENLLGTLRGCFLRAYVSEMDGSVQRYAVGVPETYDGSRPFPLVLALHDAGGDHWAGMKMVTGSSPMVVGADESNSHFYPQSLPPDFIIASPGGHGYRGAGYREKGEYDVMKVLKEMFSHYNIDADRVYLTGASKGGSGAWEIGLKYPELFAAIAPVSGAPRLAEQLTDNAGDMNFFVFHGSRDIVVPVEESRRMALLLLEAGAPLEYFEREDLGHEASTMVYKDGAIFELFRG